MQIQYFGCNSTETELSNVRKKLKRKQKREQSKQEHSAKVGTPEHRKVKPGMKERYSKNKEC